MLKKILSILLIFIALAVLICGAAFAAFRIFVPDEKLRAMLVENGRWYLERGVTLEYLSLGLFSGIELRGIAVSEWPNFKSGTFCSADRVSLKVRLLPLLHRSLSVSEVRVEKPEIHVSRDGNGDFNFVDLSRIRVTSERTEAFRRKAGGLALLIGDAEITGGTLYYADADRKDVRVELKDIAVSARNISPGKPFEAEVGFTVAGKNTPVRARLSVDTARDRVDITECVMGGERTALKVSGFCENIAGPGDMRFAFDVEGDVAVLNELTAVFPLETDLTFFPLPRVRAQITGTPARLAVKFLQ
jgi:Uncharacterized protein involved in outer membrane biogenesis